MSSIERDCLKSKKKTIIIHPHSKFVLASNGNCRKISYAPCAKMEQIFDLMRNVL